MYDSKPKEWVFSNKDLLEAVNAIKSKGKIIRDFDIPLLAGYASGDSYDIFVDKSMPEGYASRYGPYVPAIQFLIFHEGVEKALIAFWNFKYEPAHAIALRVEQDAVKAAGYNDKEYNGFMSKYIKIARDKPEYHVPKNLDMTPYSNELEIKKKMK